MKIACVLIYSFYLQTEWRRRPELRRRQVILVSSAAPTKQEVLDFTPGMVGLQRGMPLQEALSRSQGALLLEADMPCYYEAFEHVLDSLEKFSPAVEGAELGCAYVDLTGLEKLYGGEEGLKKALLDAIPPPFIARVGIGQGKFPARAVLEVRSGKLEVGSASLSFPRKRSETDYREAEESSGMEARSGKLEVGSATMSFPRKRESRELEVGSEKLEVGVEETGKERGCIREAGEDVEGFLRGCEVDILPVSWKTKKRLHSFGLHTLGQIASLPPGPLQAQFGKEGKRMWELSRGIDNRPLVPRRSEEKASVYLSFPEAATSLGVIFLAVESLLQQAFARPELRGRFVRGVILQSQVYGSSSCQSAIDAADDENIARHSREGGNPLEGHVAACHRGAACFSGNVSWERRIAFREPVGDKKRALFIIKSVMEGVSLPGPLEDLRLILFGLTGEGGRQDSFFAEVRRREQLGQAVRQLEARLHKESLIYQVRSLEPWSRIPERRQALVRFNP